MSYSPDARLLAGMLDVLTKRVERNNALLEQLLERSSGEKVCNKCCVIVQGMLHDATEELVLPQIAEIEQPAEIPAEIIETAEEIEGEILQNEGNSIPEEVEVRERKKETKKEKIPPTPPLKERNKERKKENIPPLYSPQGLFSDQAITEEPKKWVAIEKADKIISYLNEKGGTKFRAASSYRKLINKRIREGYVVDDFFKVVDNMVAAWLPDDTMRMYLRPQTLFGDKFQSYLDWRVDERRSPSSRGNGSGRYVEDTRTPSKYAGIEEVLEL
jgi:uncharacterized phage protein (TIGR02220 family)